MSKKILKEIISFIVLALFILCVGFTFYIQGVRIDYKEEILKTAERQDDRTVFGIAQCAYQEIKNGKDTRTALYDCGTYQRIFGDTGDFFAVDLINKQMLVDNSPDCMKNGTTRAFDDKTECSMHKDPEICKKALSDIYNLKDRTTWKFDDSLEHLSCSYIPSKTLGFKGPLGINGVFDKDNSQIAVCMGIQEDELFSEFSVIIENNERVTIINQIILIIIMFTSLFAVANLKSND